jgi:putative FmdB family regulatory protein
MPIFEYRCRNCDHLFEELVFSSLTNNEDIICPKCGNNNAEKMISAFSSGGSAGAGSFAGPSSCGSSGFS